MPREPFTHLQCLSERALLLPLPTQVRPLRPRKAGVGGRAARRQSWVCRRRGQRRGRAVGEPWHGIAWHGMAHQCSIRHVPPSAWSAWARAMASCQLAASRASSRQQRDAAPRAPPPLAAAKGASPSTSGSTSALALPGISSSMASPASRRLGMQGSVGRVRTGRQQGVAWHGMRAVATAWHGTKGMEWNAMATQRHVTAWHGIAMA